MAGAYAAYSLPSTFTARPEETQPVCGAEDCCKEKPLEDVGQEMRTWFPVQRAILSGGRGSINNWILAGDIEWL